MRLASLSSLLPLAAVGLLRAVAAEEAETTYFNSIAVPPLEEFTPLTWDEEIKKSRWTLVKHYSPICRHCIAFAPTFQTTYEFYHTSKPVSKDAGTKDFTEFYDFRFAALDCLAFGDTCAAHDIKVFPTTILYENGEPVKRLERSQNMTQLSAVIEETLEKTKPGSRPSAIDLPKPGDKQSPITESTKDDAELPPSPKPPKADEKPTKTYNDKGISVSLTPDTFEQLVTKTQDPWFIKYYAPWCPHCQEMAPTWEQLAKAMRGRLNIGEVNCEVEKQMCKDAQVQGYPTIVFVKGTERSDYLGLRGLGDFIRYAHNALDLASGVPDVDAKSFKALEEKEDVIFVYFYDHATTSEDFMALEKLPLKLVGNAKLVKTKDPALYDRFKITTWPRLLVSREGRPTYYPPLTPNAMRDTNQVLNWMKAVWLPLVPELVVTNSREIMDGKIVVLAVLNRDDQDAFQSGLREIKSAANEWMDRQILEFQLERKKLRDAKQMRIEEAEDRGDQRALRAAKAIRIDMDTSGRKEVAFAWVDGFAGQRWIRTTYGIDIKDGEKVIINDEDRRKYWDTTVTGNYILVSRTSILETLDKIVYSPQLLKPKLSVSYLVKVFIEIRSTFTDHPYLTMSCIALLAYGIFSWFRVRPRARRGHFRLDSRNVRDFKSTEMFSGLNSATKAD